MPRPPKPVSPEYFEVLYPKLARLLADPDKAAQDINGVPELAIAAFASVGDSPDRLNEWVSRWLTSAAKRRMWASLRQTAYKKNQNAKTLLISDEAYTALSAVAKRQQLTLSDAILFLSKEER